MDLKRSIERRQIGDLFRFRVLAIRLSNQWVSGKLFSIGLEGTARLFLFFFFPDVWTLSDEYLRDLVAFVNAFGYG